MTGGQRDLTLTKDELESSTYTFRIVKELVFSEEMNQNKNVRFVYQGKMLKDTDTVKGIHLQYPITYIHAIVSNSPEQMANSGSADVQPIG